MRGYPYVLSPRTEIVDGDHAHESADDRLYQHCQIIPTSLGAEIYWTLDPNDFPEPQYMKITWDPCDPNRPHVGIGPNPQLKVTYVNPQSKYDDYMPPDNRWFGKKTLTIQIGSETVTRPLWCFYHAEANRHIRQGGKMEYAYFHYWKVGGAVPLLAQLNFAFDDTLQANAAYTWDNLTKKETFRVGRSLNQLDLPKSKFIVGVPDSYDEEPYPTEDEATGIHALMKACWHEYWHQVFRNETRWWPDGLGYTDWDGDGLWTNREKELGTKRFNVDTYGLSRYADAEGAYKIYYLYADQELFCRIKEITAPKGDPTKDWSQNGAQWPKWGN